MRPAPDARVVRWIERVKEETLHLSVLTLGEIERGVAKLAPSARRRRIEAWLRADLPARFEGRILPVDGTVAARWGLISAAAERKGRPLPAIDSLIGATALVHRLAVVTRNVADFVPTGVRCVDPWALRR